MEFGVWRRGYGHPTPSLLVASVLQYILWLPRRLLPAFGLERLKYNESVLYVHSMHTTGRPAGPIMHSICKYIARPSSVPNPHPHRSPHPSSQFAVSRLLLRNNCNTRHTIFVPFDRISLNIYTYTYICVPAGSERSDSLPGSGLLAKWLTD